MQSIIGITFVINDDRYLSPCSLAARGLSQLMLNAAKRPAELPVEGVSLRELAAVKRIVVYLPDDPVDAHHAARRQGSSTRPCRRYRC